MEMEAYRETALQELSFVVDGTALRLLADPTNAWGKSSTKGGSMQHCNTGNRLWPAAAILVEFLWNAAIVPSPSEAAGTAPFFETASCPVPPSKAPTRVIELGAGLGAVGLALARRGAHVVLTDQAQMLPLLRRNVHASFGASAGWNAGGGCWCCCDSGGGGGGSTRRKSEGGGCTPEVRALTWGADAATCLAGLPPTYDLVVGSDLCYDADAFPALHATLDAVCKPGGTVVLAVHDRPDVAAFFVTASSRFSWRLSKRVECAPDPVSGRSTILVYVGRSASTATALSGADELAERAADAFSLGDAVEAHSLAKVALNGVRGMVVSKRGLIGWRVGVVFPPPHGRLAIKASNLRLLGTAPFVPDV